MVLAPGFSEYLIPFAGPAAARDWVTRKRADLQQYGFAPWVVEIRQTREFVGCVGLSKVPYQASFTPAVEIAWRLRNAFRGFGYATEAAQAALSDGFDRCGLVEVVANTVPDNLPSRRVMERIGMKYASEFDHPLVPLGHPFRRQVLYRIARTSP